MILFYAVLCTLGVWPPKFRKAGSSPYPTDGEEETRRATADSSKAVSEPPVEEVFRDKGDKGQPHGGGQHVEDTRHVVHVQLA